MHNKLQCPLCVNLRRRDHSYAFSAMHGWIYLKLTTATDAFSIIVIRFIHVQIDPQANNETTAFATTAVKIFCNQPYSLFRGLKVNLLFCVNSALFRKWFSSDCLSSIHFRSFQLLLKEPFFTLNID